jgi:hypothetical protein
METQARSLACASWPCHENEGEVRNGPTENAVIEKEEK